MDNKNHVCIEGTIISSLSLLLSLIPFQIGSSFTISLGQIPFTLFALRRGWQAGMIAGFLWGILHFPTGQVHYLDVFQVLIEYPIAFTFNGIEGIFANKVQRNLRQKETNQLKKNIILGTLVGIGARYFWHFIAGVVFWESYAMWGINPCLFSLIMNGVSGLVTGIVTITVLLGIQKTMPSLFKGN